MCADSLLLYRVWPFTVGKSVPIKPWGFRRNVCRSWKGEAEFGWRRQGDSANQRLLSRSSILSGVRIVIPFFYGIQMSSLPRGVQRGAIARRWRGRGVFVCAGRAYRYVFFAVSLRPPPSLGRGGRRNLCALRTHALHLLTVTAAAGWESRVVIRTCALLLRSSGFAVELGYSWYARKGSVVRVGR